MEKETEIQISTELVVSIWYHSTWSQKQPETEKCAIGVDKENFKISTYFWPEELENSSNW